MSKTFDLVIEGGSVVTPNANGHQTVVADIAIEGGRIAEIGDLAKRERQKTFKAKGLHVLPGLIDTQVHFREPGNTEKEDLATGTRAAVFGGITGIFDMPNTKPPTLSAVDVADKMGRAKGRAWCNYAFYVGASKLNADRLGELENLPGVCGVKMFLGSSTGDLFVGTDEVIKTALRSSRRRMAAHCEDEARLIERKKIVQDKPGHVELHPVWRDEEAALLATKKLVGFAREAKRPVHVLHVTTAEELEFLKNAKDVASVEITPQHLTLAAPECYERLGTLAQMNPPIRDKRHREALWAALNAGIVDVLGSDHAPHLLAEKAKTYPDTPSGMPGVQTMVPLMLNFMNEGRLTLHRIVELLAANPARLFGIRDRGAIRVGHHADFTVVDLKAKREITNSWIQSRCGWTPYDGMTVTGWVAATLIGGQVVFRDDQIVGHPIGSPLF